MTQRDLILALDAGTSVVKAALFDRHGAERAVVRRPTTAISPRRGWSEVSMDETWLMVCAAIQELLKEYDPSRIAAVGITGQMVGA